MVDYVHLIEKLIRVHQFLKEKNMILRVMLCDMFYSLTEATLFIVTFG